MKLKVSVGSLAEACNQAKQTLDRLPSNPLGNMYLRASKKSEEDQFLYCYSNNVRSETLIKIPAEVEEEGEALVHPAKLLDFLSARPKEEQIALVADDKRLKLQYKRCKAEVALHGQSKALYEMIQKLPFTAQPWFTVKGADLAEFVRRGMFCIPTDDNGQTGQVVGGMNFTDSEEGYEAQATDGAIAAQIKIKAEGSAKMGNFMLPMGSLPALSSLVARRREEEIALVPGPKGQYGMSKVYFRFGDVIFGSVLLHGQFPAIKQVVDAAKPKHRFSVGREELRKSLTCCSAFATRSRTVRIEVKKDCMDMRVHGDSDEVMESVTVTNETEPDGVIKVAMGLDYLINIASGSHGSDLIFGMTDGVRPIVIADESDERVFSKYVLMPVKVS